MNYRQYRMWLWQTAMLLIALLATPYPALSSDDSLAASIAKLENTFGISESNRRELEGFIASATCRFVDDVDSLKTIEPKYTLIKIPGCESNKEGGSVPLIQANLSCHSDDWGTIHFRSLTCIAKTPGAKPVTMSANECLKQAILDRMWMRGLSPHSFDQEPKEAKGVQ